MGRSSEHEVSELLTFLDKLSNFDSSYTTGDLSHADKDNSNSSNFWVFGFD